MRKNSELYNDGNSDIDNNLREKVRLIAALFIFKFVCHLSYTEQGFHLLAEKKVVLLSGKAVFDSIM